MHRARSGWAHNADLAAHIGERIYVEAAGKAAGGWGHVDIDDVNVPVRRT